MSRPFPARTALSAALAALVISLGARAAMPLPHGDAKFIQQAAAGSLAEIDLGKLAQQKALREEVHEFATRMVEDHSKAYDEMKKIAQAHGIEIATMPGHEVQEEHAKLDKLLGGDFDRAYMKHMVSDHRHDVDEFKEEARARKDSDAKTFAAKTLPTLRTHLAMAIATNDIAQDPKRSGDRRTGSKKD